MSKYDDIINLKRPTSRHIKLGINSRASQFLPFSALVGYNDIIEENNKIIDNKLEISDDYKEVLDLKLNHLFKYINDNIKVRVCYFVEDKFKDGGKYVTLEGNLNKIDYNLRVIKLDDKIIEIDNIVGVDSKLLDNL